MTLSNAIKEWQKGNYENCLSVIKQYAKNDNSEAQFILAMALSTEHWGFNEDIPLSLKWFEKAYENGCPYSSIHIALILDPENSVYTGKIEQNAEIAKKYYKIDFNNSLQEAENGNPEFMYRLGNCYLSGWGVTYNQQLGEKWMKKSEELGYILILECKIKMYKSGKD